MIKKPRRHNPCPKDPSGVDLGRKLVMLQSCEWMQFMWCVCCLNVPNGEGRFEWVLNGDYRSNWHSKQHLQRHSVASGTETGKCRLPQIIHSFILFPIHLTMTSEGLIGTKDLCLLLGTQCGGKMHTILVYMELLVQKAKAVGCSAKLGL